jgi:hypothetical protein
MKKSILLLAFLFYSVLLFTLQNVNAQIPAFKCGTMEYLQRQKELDPGLEAKMFLQEKQIQQWINENYIPDSNKVITIPIVVHIIYNTDEQNIPDLRVFEQIEMLNRDYAGLNTHSMQAFSDTLKSNTGIQFCLAKRKPDGTPTNGIERRYTTTAYFITDDKVKNYNWGGMNCWDTKKYMNIWVCNLTSLCGYGKFPGYGLNETYGAVINYGFFGKTGVSPYYNNGATTSHELGHCLNLYHIWGDDKGECWGTDNCNDTPNQSNYIMGAPMGILTDACSQSNPGVMYMNFMDYSDDTVKANFTPDQTARMQACFGLPSGPLVSLLSSDACSPATSCESNTVLTSSDFSIFPNPANEQVTINYTITEPGMVSFTIINSLGIEISKINNDQMQEPGNYIINYDTSSLRPGIYYLTIRAGNYTETKSFVVIR